jgi:hypothetical protein
LTVHWFWIVPLVLLIVFIASPRFRGDIAETRVRRILAAGLEKNRYTIFNDVTIPSSGGTTHIDHIVVSRFGIFVIESQHARGWVSGAEFQERWKQYHLRRFTRFDNPMHRNALQLQALENLLRIPASKLHPVVVMVGQKGFKTAMPGNLLQPEKLIAYMRKKAHHILDGDQADRMLKAIEDARIRTASRKYIGKWTLVQIFLLVALIAGVYLAFRDDIADLQEKFVEQKEKKESPGTFHPDGSRKSERELWEDSLVCAYSSDSDRCTCYEPGGSRADVEPEKCRSLAERGSILKQ